jgi:hypothetical protein
MILRSIVWNPLPVASAVPKVTNNLSFCVAMLVTSCTATATITLAILKWRGTFIMERTFGSDSSPKQDAIRRRATALYKRSGAVEGHDVENWCQAEAELLRESTTHPVRRAVVVNLNGVVYTGEYESASADDYAPGEWKPGDPVPVRLAGDKLYLRRPNGRELQTTIVKRIG